MSAYVPSSMWKQVAVSTQTLCQGNCGTPCGACARPRDRSSQSVVKGHAHGDSKLVFTLQQEYSTLDDNLHQQIAKVTVDDRGNLVKFAISR